MTRIHFEKTKAHANGLMWEWLTFHLPLFAFAPPPTPPLKPTQEKKKKNLTWLERKIHFCLGVLKLNSVLWLLGRALTPNGFSLKTRDAAASPSLWEVTKST